MIFIVFGLMLFGLWYVTDKKLGSNFKSYLKYPSLAVIVFFVLVDINLMMETNQYIATQKYAPNGFTYVDPTTGTTTRLYGAATTDSASVMAYHYAEFEVWKIFVMILPEMFLAIGGFMIFQILHLWYDEYRGKTTVQTSKLDNRQDQRGRK